MKPKVRKTKNTGYRSSPASQPLETARDAGGRILESFKYLGAHYGRFARDIFGIALMVFSALTLLALLNLTDGNLLNLLAVTLKRWFGAGAILLDLTLVLLGYFILRRKGNFWGDHFWKVLYLELIIISFLVLLSILSGYDLGLAQAGKWGGLTGWAISQGTAELLGSRFLASSVWILFTIFLGWAGFAILRKPGLIKVETQANSESIVPVPSMAGSTKRLTVESRYAETSGQQRVKNGKQTSNPVSQPAKKPVAQSRPGKLVVTPVIKPIQNLTNSEDNRFPAPAGKPYQAPRNNNREVALPPVSFLLDEQVIRLDENTINETAQKLERTLMDFGIPVRTVGYRMGPTVTQFALEPGVIEKPASEGQTLKQKIRVSQIAQLKSDIALALSATSIRIEAPVPGKSYIGVEIPNVRSVVVRLKALLESDKFIRLNSPLALAFGRDVSGQPVVGDLARMPHLLIAGATNSGKTVCMTALGACLAMCNTPRDLRMIMIDPKMVELVRFNGLPHMLGRVEYKMERIIGVLRWATLEMDRRYITFTDAAARDLSVYNRKMAKLGEPTLPRIVIFIDELAELMNNEQAIVEPLLVRLTQLARATGIHLVVATQRPSVNVVTGKIKANIPARVAFAVASHIDSRVILDTTGAESLVGKGDMLFQDPENPVPVRTQGVMVSDEELDQIIAYWNTQQPADPNEPAPWDNMLFEEKENGGDELLQRAIEMVKVERSASASQLQRKLRIGYPRAARLIEEMEALGVVGPSRGGGKDREVLIELDDEQDI